MDALGCGRIADARRTRPACALLAVRAATVDSCRANAAGFGASDLGGGRTRSARHDSGDRQRLRIDARRCGLVHATRHVRDDRARWLKTPPARHSPSTITETLSQVRFLKSLGTRAWNLDAVPIEKQRAYSAYRPGVPPRFVSSRRRRARYSRSFSALHVAGVDRRAALPNGSPRVRSRSARLRSDDGQARPVRCRVRPAADVNQGARQRYKPLRRRTARRHWQVAGGSVRQAADESRSQRSRNADRRSSSHPQPAGAVTRTGSVRQGG